MEKFGLNLVSSALNPQAGSVDNHNQILTLKRQIAEMQEQIRWYDAQNNSFSNLCTILAVELFRAQGKIVDNLLAAPGHPPIEARGDLVHSVSQSQIDKIEHLFPGSMPALGWTQSQDAVSKETHLVFHIKSQTEVEKENAMKGN